MKAKTHRFEVRLTAKEKKEWGREARRYGVPLAAWLRRTANTECKRDHLVTYRLEKRIEELEAKLRPDFTKFVQRDLPVGRGSILSPVSAVGVMAHQNGVKV